MWLLCINDKGKKKDIENGKKYFAVEGDDKQYFVSGKREMIYLDKTRFEVVEE